MSCSLAGTGRAHWCYSDGFTSFRHRPVVTRLVGASPRTMVFSFSAWRSKKQHRVHRGDCQYCLVQWASQWVDVRTLVSARSLEVSQSVCGDGWCNHCTLIVKCTTLVHPHPVPESDQSDQGQGGCLNQPSSIHPPHQVCMYVSCMPKSVYISDAACPIHVSIHVCLYVSKSLCMSLCISLCI
jgi:hypothetical protein